MSGVYSTRFIGAQGATAPISYTVPNGYVAVVRDLDAYSDTVASAEIFLRNAEGGAIYFFTWGVAQQQSVEWRGRQVYFAGETITVDISVGALDAIDVAVSGYLLTSS